MPRRLLCLSKLSAAVALLALASGAIAQTLTFEGSTTSGANRKLDVDTANTHGPSLIDYAGYDWLGMMVAKPLVSVGNPQMITGFTTPSDPGYDAEDGPQPLTSPVDAGFHRSMVSGDTVAFTQAFSGSTFASIAARPNSANFNFVSSYLTSGWRDDISVTVTGKRGTTTVYSQTLTVGDDAPTLYSFNFTNIDKVEFLVSGGTFFYPNGTQIGGYINSGNAAFSAPVLVFDNITLAPVPEPESYALMLAGLGLIGFAARRRKQMSAV